MIIGALQKLVEMTSFAFVPADPRNPVMSRTTAMHINVVTGTSTQGIASFLSIYYPSCCSTIGTSSHLNLTRPLRFHTRHDTMTTRRPSTVPDLIRRLTCYQVLVEPLVPTWNVPILLEHPSMSMLLHPQSLQTAISSRLLPGPD